MPIKPLNKRIFEGFYLVFKRFSDYKNTSREQLAAIIKKSRANHRILCYTEKERVLGYIIIRIDYDIEATRKIALITDFYVRKEARGQGLGTQLFQAALALTEKESVQYVNVLTRPKFKPALRLYKRFGFKKTGLILLRRK